MLTELEKLHLEAVANRKVLLDSITPKEPVARVSENKAVGVIGEMTESFSEIVEEHPAISVASALTFGILIEKLSEHLAAFGAGQLHSLKQEGEKILKKTMEKKLEDILEVGITLAAAPLAQFVNDTFKSSSLQSPKLHEANHHKENKDLIV